MVWARLRGRAWTPSLRRVKVLFLAQRVPYPPNRGDKITTWRLVERLKRDHEVTVIAFAHDEGDRKAAQQLRGMGIETITVPHEERRKKLTALPLLLTRKPLTLGVYGSSQLQEAVDRLLPEVDMAYAFSSSMGAFLVDRGVPWVMHFAELDSDKWRQYAEQKGLPMSWVYRREWRTLLEFERRIAADTVTNVFCTPIEQAIFQDQIPGPSSVVMRNGVDLKHFAPAPDKTEAGHLVFTGVMDYFPNADGCQHFVAEILPRVVEEFPDVRFSIVGSKPTPDVEKLAQTNGVTVTGFVDETRDWLERASIAVAPLRIARGIQNKVLEAMAVGLPVVGTPCATQGVEAISGRHLLVAESAQEQAHLIRGLLREPAQAQRIGASARSFVEERYDWEVALAPLDEVVEQCVQARKTQATTT